MLYLKEICYNSEVKTTFIQMSLDRHFHSTVEGYQLLFVNEDETYSESIALSDFIDKCLIDGSRIELPKGYKVIIKGCKKSVLSVDKDGEDLGCDYVDVQLLCIACSLDRYVIDMMDLIEPIGGSESGEGWFFSAYVFNGLFVRTGRTGTYLPIAYYLLRKGNLFWNSVEEDKLCLKWSDNYFEFRILDKGKFAKLLIMGGR